ncbi:glycosyltransferase [Acidobacteria bacterium AH-259-O06]|nr:glycosyltransferase [Acidobacteria bacterium AH-259-O06]
MLSTPLVTVVIPTYNQGHFLREALQSVCAQTFSDWEAVVVNNYSEDDTIAVVESFEGTRIRLKNFRNNGVIAASRNRGIALARGRYVAFLDSDDTWYPDKLARCIQRLDEGFDLVCHGIRSIGVRRERDLYCGPEQSATFDALLYEGNCLVTSATVVRRDLVESVGGFSEEEAIVTAEDYHLWIRLAKASAQMSFLREILGEYRVHSRNQSSAVLWHMRAVRHVIEGFFPEAPARSLITRMRVRRRLGIVYYATGRGMQQDGQFSNAWPLFFRALAYWPFYTKTYAAIVLNAIGRGPFL